MAYEETTVEERTVTGFFDTRDQAESAKRDLIAAGFSESSISIVGNAGSAATSSAPATEPKGFWEELKEFFIPDEDRYTYAEGLRRGGYLLTVRTSETKYDQALEILDSDGTVDLDERASTWRSEGWTGFTGDTSTAGAGLASSGSIASSTVDTTSRIGARAGGSSIAGGAASAGASSSTAFAGKADHTSTVGRDEAIPVIEEQLRVGKRDINHGRVRVRSYVVEKPVQEDITLRNTKVEVERRTVDRPVGPGDTLFQDRVIEAEQHSEEAIVDKQARVTEEIRLRKDVEERTETVSDTVKKTEVEVQDERGKKIASSSTSSSSSSTSTAPPRRV